MSFHWQQDLKLFNLNSTTPAKQFVISFRFVYLFSNTNIRRYAKYLLFSCHVVHILSATFLSFIISNKSAITFF